MNRRPVEICGDICKVPMTRGHVAIVDREDYDTVAAHTWTSKEHRHTVYGKTTVGDKTVYIHQMLTGNRLTDHRDGDGLNNRRGNLRRATVAQNVSHQGSYRERSLPKGVISIPSKINPYAAAITYKYKRYHLGCYKTPEEAHLAYGTAAIVLFGEFAKTC